MSRIPFWQVWKNRRGRVKGVCIVFQAADFGLELHSDFSQEGDRLAFCEDLCKVLNEAPRSTYVGQGAHPQHRAGPE